MRQNGHSWRSAAGFAIRRRIRLALRSRMARPDPFYWGSPPSARRWRRDAFRTTSLRVFRERCPTVQVGARQLDGCSTQCVAHSCHARSRLRPARIARARAGYTTPSASSSRKRVGSCCRASSRAAPPGAPSAYRGSVVEPRRKACIVGDARYPPTKTPASESAVFSIVTRMRLMLRCALVGLGLVAGMPAFQTTVRASLRLRICALRRENVLEKLRLVDRHSTPALRREPRPAT